MTPQGDYDCANETQELIPPGFGLQGMGAYCQDEKPDR